MFFWCSRNVISSVVEGCYGSVLYSLGCALLQRKFLHKVSCIVSSLGSSEPFVLVRGWNSGSGWCVPVGFCLRRRGRAGRRMRNFTEMFQVWSFTQTSVISYLWTNGGPLRVLDVTWVASQRCLTPCKTHVSNPSNHDRRWSVSVADISPFSFSCSRHEELISARS